MKRLLLAPGQDFRTFFESRRFYAAQIMKLMIMREELIEPQILNTSYFICSCWAWGFSILTMRYRCKEPYRVNTIGNIAIEITSSNLHLQQFNISAHHRQYFLYYFWKQGKGMENNQVHTSWTISCSSNRHG